VTRQRYQLYPVLELEEKCAATQLC
jgi:hypothetical protein